MSPALDRSDIDRLVVSAPKAVLGTRGPDGAPQLVPVTFAIDGDTLYTAVDHKPKSTRRLARLDNIERDPRVSLLVDHYDDDWSALWWCRLDGRAVVVDTDAAATRLLAAKYPQYVQHPVTGPIIVVTVAAASGWRAAD